MEGGPSSKSNGVAHFTKFLFLFLGFGLVVAAIATGISMSIKSDNANSGTNEETSNAVTQAPRSGAEALVEDDAPPCGGAANDGGWAMLSTSTAFAEAMETVGLGCFSKCLKPGEKCSTCLRDREAAFRRYD